ARLQRPGWVTPVLMTAAIIFTLYAICWLFILLSNAASKGPHARHIRFGAPGLWPFYIGLFLGVCGSGFGIRFTSTARTTVGQRFGVVYLPNDHWVTRRV